MQESGAAAQSDTMTSRTPWTLVLLAVAAALPGAALAQGIRVTDAWSRPTPPGIDVGVAYFTIRNDGKSDRLLRASSSVAKRAELHTSSVKNGVARMGGLDAVDVASGTPTAFEPSGRHVMLMGLKRPLKEGDVFPLVLTFANAGQVEVRVRVRGVGSTEGSDHMR
jgi:copper(I)-binding protein